MVGMEASFIEESGLIGYPDMAAKIAKHLKISVSLELQVHQSTILQFYLIDI